MLFVVRCSLRKVCRSVCVVRGLMLVGRRCLSFGACCVSFGVLRCSLCVAVVYIWFVCCSLIVVRGCSNVRVRWYCLLFGVVCVLVS